MSSYYREDYQVKILGKDAVYTGEISSKDFNPHGFGTAVFSNGDAFKGFFKKGDPTYGTYTFSNGSYCKVEYSYNFSKSYFYTRYVKGSGDYRNARYNKKEEVSNGYYLGEMINGVRSGIGKFVWDSGDSYEGGWLNGKRHGVGKYTWSDGDYDIKVYDAGKEVCVLSTYRREYDSVNTYSGDNYSYDYSSNDGYSSDDTYTTTDRMFDEALDKINNGSSEDALYALKNLRSFCDADDYYFEDEMGHRINVDEQIREIESYMNSDD